MPKRQIKDNPFSLQPSVSLILILGDAECEGAAVMYSNAVSLHRHNSSLITQTCACLRLTDHICSLFRNSLCHPARAQLSSLWSTFLSHCPHPRTTTQSNAATKQQANSKTKSLSLGLEWMSAAETIFLRF